MIFKHPSLLILRESSPLTLPRADHPLNRNEVELVDVVFIVTLEVVRIGELLQSIQRTFLVIGIVKIRSTLGVLYLSPPGEVSVPQSRGEKVIGFVNLVWPLLII